MPEFISQEEKKILCRNMATNLPSLRAKVGLTQDQLAERLGFSRQTINAIENGKREMQWSTFTSLAMFFIKDQEIKELMIVMGIVNNHVEEIFNLEKREL